MVLRERFNSGVAYKGRVSKWDAIIELKVSELSQFLVGKYPALDFVEPAPRLKRHDNKEIRARILALTAAETKSFGIGKGTLHYLRKKVSRRCSFKTYQRTFRKLDSVRLPSQINRDGV